VADWKADRIASAERGENPMVLARLPSGYAVLSDTQFLPGYCFLLASPRVRDLGDLDLEARAAFLVDMSLLGDAVQAVCEPWRLNYAILGNQKDYLHAHVIPRYEWEPEERRLAAPWRYPVETWSTAPYSEEEHGELRRALAARLAGLGRRVSSTP
jgi:diadenosine tetraphosphate (Ap4A) HIT family hydrolase